MLLFVTGLPGGLIEWCETAVLRLARLHGAESIALIHSDSLEGIAINALASGGSDWVVSARQPGGKLLAALIDSGQPFIVALDDPRTALLDLVLGRGVPLPDATQAVASSCAALLGCAASPGAFVVDGSQDGREQREIAAAIAQHLRLAADRRDLDEVAETLPVCGGAGHQHEAAAWWSGLAEADRALVTGALAPYLDRRSAGYPLALTWAGELFFHGDRPTERASAPVDITGRARCLISGPEIIVPAGTWRLSLALLASREAAEHEFLVEVQADRVLASATVRPQPEGGIEIEVPFVLETANERPLSVRISTLRAAFDGAIAVDRARLVRDAEGGLEPETETALSAGPEL